MKRQRKTPPPTFPPDPPRLTEDAILNMQVRQFSEAWAALDAEEKQLDEMYHIARNLAASEWEPNLIPSVAGGFDALSPSRMLPDKLDVLRKNDDLLRTDISRRRYVLILTYRQFLEKAGRWDWVEGKQDPRIPIQTNNFSRMWDCFQYWHNPK